MNAIELFQIDTTPEFSHSGNTQYKSAGVFYCEKCRRVQPSKTDAENCCQPYHCQVCDIELTGNRLICWPCSVKKEAAKEQAKFEAAEKVTAYDGPVWIPNSGDWYHTVGDMLDDIEPDELPDYVWTSTITPVCQLDYESIIENATQEAWEGFDSVELDGIEEFEAAIQVFNEANKSLTQWTPNYKIAVIPGEGGWNDAIQSNERNDAQTETPETVSQA